jgi:hypothetical protein
MEDMVRTLRYLRTWLSGRAASRESTILVDRGDRTVPARLLVPERGRPPFPAWILLHGVTRPGFSHPLLERFSRAVAASGSVVLIPEVPEWKDLRLSPEATLPTVQAGIRALEALPEAASTPHGLIGFSFGGPQALAAASDPSVARQVAGVTSFGGYCNLRRTLRFQFTGRHEWKGREEHTRPDPYGRWVVGANYLTVASAHTDAEDVAQALWVLAAEAGERRIPAWSPEYDPLKASLRGGIAPTRRALFDLFAPVSDHDPDPLAAQALADVLTEGARRVAPLLDPPPGIGQGVKRIELLHGRGDRLIPYTESLRMRESLGPDSPANLTVTRLFAHAAGDRFPRLRGAREVWIFVRALGRILGMI